MVRKNQSGAFPAKGRSAVEIQDIVSAIREGRLTRRQFEAWHAKRRGASKGFVIAMRETPPDGARPRKHSARKHKASRPGSQ